MAIAEMSMKNTQWSMSGPCASTSLEGPPPNLASEHPLDSWASSGNHLRKRFTVQGKKTTPKYLRAAILGNHEMPFEGTPFDRVLITYDLYAFLEEAPLHY